MSPDSDAQMLSSSQDEGRGSDYHAKGVPTIRLTAAPFRRYNAADIFTLESLTLKRRRVLWRIQELDAFGRGQYGCFATIANLAKDVGMTPQAVRSHVSRLHKDGYIAFIGVRGRLVCRRVTLSWEPQVFQKPQVKAFMADKFLAGEQALAEASSHMTIVDVCQADVPTLEEYRASRASYEEISATEFAMEPSQITGEIATHSLKEKNKEEIPPFGGNSSSNLSFSQSCQTSTRGSQTTDQTPEDVVSHKRKDWLGLLRQQIFFEILKTRFPGYSLSDAKKVMGLVQRRGICPERIGYALEHLKYLPVLAEQGKTARPQNLYAFCRDFDAVENLAKAGCINYVESDYIAEFEECSNPGDGCVDASRQNLDRALKQAMDPFVWLHDWKQRCSDIWTDVAWLVEYLGLPGSWFILELPAKDLAYLYERLGIYADVALVWCQRVGRDFEEVFCMPYEVAKARGVAFYESMKAEYRSRTEPAMWKPKTPAALTG